MIPFKVDFRKREKNHHNDEYAAIPEHSVPEQILSPGTANYPQEKGKNHSKDEYATITHDRAVSANFNGFRAPLAPVGVHAARIPSSVQTRTKASAAHAKACHSPPPHV